MEFFHFTYDIASYHDLVGFGVTLAILKQLIKPIEVASMALRSYKEERQVPDYFFS
jgi:hypothetical protein